MKTIVIRWAIVLVVVAQIGWALLPRNLGSPESPETIEAIHAYQASPSAETKAAMLERIHQDVSRNTLHGRILIGLMLLADAVIAYHLWNYGVKKIAA